MSYLTPEQRRQLKLLDTFETLRSRVTELEADVKAGLQISGSFFEALKPLKLQTINVTNPGQHVTDLIQRIKVLEEMLDTFAAEELIAEYSDTAHLACEKLQDHNRCTWCDSPNYYNLEVTMGDIRRAAKLLKGRHDN